MADRRITSNDFSRANLDRLAEVHIRRYANRVTAGQLGSREVNLTECRAYLEIWRKVKANPDFTTLPKECQREVVDAINAGE